MSLKLDQHRTAAAEYADILAAVEVGQLEMKPELRSKVAAKYEIARAAAGDAAAGWTPATATTGSHNTPRPSPGVLSRMDIAPHSPLTPGGAAGEEEEPLADLAPPEVAPAPTQPDGSLEPPPALVPLAEEAGSQPVDGTAPATAPAQVEEPAALPVQDLAAAATNEASLSAPLPEPEPEMPAQAKPEAAAMPPSAAAAAAAPVQAPILAEAPPESRTPSPGPHAPSGPTRHSEGFQERTMAAASALASAAVSAAMAVASSPMGKALSGHKGAESPAAFDLRGGDVGGYGYAGRLGRESTHSLGGFFASFTGTSTAAL